ncbi:MAG: HAMP domain-containing sensor histidine kinase [Nakamurella sp.]
MAGGSAQDTADSAVVKAAARRVGVQLALVCAGVVVIVAVLAFTLVGRHTDLGPANQELASDNDALVRDGILVAGVIGIVIAGVVGWWAARDAVRPLGRALQLQRQFVADAGHELRTPLTILHTRAQLLARRLPPDSPDRELAEQLLADSRVLGEIVDELLASAQLSQDPARSETFAAADLLDEVVASVSVLAADGGVGLTADGEADLVLTGSRVALRRALVALTDNALAHTPAGGAVRLRARTVGAEAVVTISDTGEGLDPADADRLLARFTRGVGDTPGIGPRRFGLGLSLVAEIARAHGGRLDLTGSPGQGAVATLTLPSTRR